MYTRPRTLQHFLTAATLAWLSPAWCATATTTVLAGSPQQVAFGQSIFFSASVSGTNPSGTITFKDGSTPLATVPVSGNTATYSTNSLALGSHLTLTATYNGDSANAPSTSPAWGEGIVAPGPLPAVPTSPTPVTTYQYDAQGHPTQTTLAPGTLNLNTTATYDPLYRVKDSTDAKAGKTQYTYTGQDALTQVTDPRSLTTQTPRNGLGDITQLASPDTGTATHTFDAAGNLKTRTDSRGVLATYSYDALSRLKTIVYSQSGQTSLTYSWGYDNTGTGYAYGIGRLTRNDHPAGTARYLYDPQGRLVQAVQSILASPGANASNLLTTTTYTYDAAGHLTGITYPSGRVLSITYSGGQASAMSLAKDASSTPVPILTNIQWQPFGPVSSWQRPINGTSLLHQNIYDTSGRIVRYRLARQVRDITYDAADRITQYTHYNAIGGMAQPGFDQSFAYDELGRLTGVVTPTASWSIGYDANGNRTGVTLNGAAQSYTTPATSNKLQAISNPARTFAYDNAGNTTGDSAGYTATYDLAGRLSTLAKAGITTTYSYNAQGQRVRKFSSTGAASTVLFVYGPQGELLGEYDSTGKAIKEYVWLGSTPVAVFMPDPANAANPPSILHIHADHTGTPRVLTDRNDVVVWTWITAEPFGTTAPTINALYPGFAFNLRMPGQYFDQESGLHYNWHRSYDATRGAYTTPDPLGLDGGSASLYAYVGGNPVSYTDPTGLINYQGQELLDRWFGPKTPPGQCATAECAAGVLPVTKPSPLACFTACFAIKTGGGILIGKGTGAAATWVGPKVGALTNAVLNSPASLTISEALGVNYCAKHCGYEIPSPPDSEVCVPDPLTGAGCCWFK